MFTAGKFKIRFERINKTASGRFDTKCWIYCKAEEPYPYSWMKIPYCSGKAVLHPNDKPDRVLGKKIALRNALFNRFGSIKGPLYHEEFKPWSIRKMIWEGFWRWVGCWPVCRDGIERNEAEICRHGNEKKFCSACDL